ncbi:MAG: TonB-dependent receptor, partial [Bacteroidota bacterium]
MSASIAQQPDTVFTLQPVTISSECQKQNQLAVKMDSILFQYQVNGSATQLLQRNSMLYVRQFGSGALATLNSLGFNSARNPVLWNSMLLNNPMNASQDINLIPLWFLERSSIQSVSYPFTGTSVSLYSNPKFENSLSLFTSYQSFGNLNYGVKWKQNFRRLSFSFAGIHQQNQNRINYFNSYELKKDTMEHARADMLGVNTLLQYRISESNTLEACVWYVDANRLLPPSMLQTISRSVEFDKQLRAYLQWTLRKNRFKSVWQNSVNNDVVIYHDSLSAIYADNHSRVYQSQWQGEYFAGNQLAIPVMFRYQYIEATTDNYILRVIQQRLYLEAAPRLLIPSWHTTAQITASREIAMGLYAANALKATLIKSFGSAWVWTNEAGRLFQLPTLN